jgi:ACR3 family arsenite transporter
MENEASVERREEKLGIFEKYLTLWIAVCIILGLLLGRFFPEFASYLDSLKVAKLSVPIGICLFFMMYPTVAGIAFSDIKKAVKKPKPMFLTIIANWVIAPPLMTLYANLFLRGHPDYIAGVILLGMSPCTAMVMWWMMLAEGDLAQGLINTAINALLMIFLYAPQSAFYLGVSGIPVPWDLIALSVIVFIALPVSLGAISRKELINRKGKEWFENTYLETVRKISVIALLLTLIVMFSLQGEIILKEPLLVGYLAAPNLLHYVTMIVLIYSISWLSNWDYPTSIDTTIIGSSSHFEIAIAVATTLYGLNSGAALATVIGPLMEVPLMLFLVRFGLRTRHLFPKIK